MKYAKNFISALAVLAVLATSGCSPASMEDVREKAFVTEVRAKYDVDMSDAELIAAGRQVCEEFDIFGVAGAVGIAIGAIVVDESNADPEILGHIMWSSASALCPEYMDDLSNLG